MDYETQIENDFMRMIRLCIKNKLINSNLSQCILYNPGNMSDQGNLSNMLRTIHDKDNFLNVAIYSHDPLLSQKNNLSIKNDFLCKVIGSQDNFTIKTEIDLKSNLNLHSALKMTGFLDLKFSYIDSAKSFKNESYVRASSGISFREWLIKKTNERTLVPDTNTIIDHIFSAVKFVTTNDIFDITKIMIPRLVILELEKLANIKNKDQLERKRKIFLAFSEIISQQNQDNVHKFPKLSSNILAKFPEISGKYSADSWIRHEIQNYDANVLSEKRQEEDMISSIEWHSFVLLTSDLVNSLSASSEGIDTIYVSEVINPKNEKHVLIPGSLQQVTQFLIIMSILFGTIYLKINSINYRFQGFWKGITNSDIINYKIKISSTS